MKTVRLFPDQYPLLLRQIEPPPKFLDCAGTLPPPDDYKFLCVVGARKFSEYGKDACIKLIDGLRNYPIVIVSGLAIGIDSIAHEAALKAKMKVIAFPGSGLARTSIYPRSHLRLAEQIVESGNTILSPFERNNFGADWTFPVRNRLMAGISHATLVIEGCKGSGTLLTASNAVEFSRDVLALPGSIFAESSYGPHMLIRKGATPIFNSDDILTALGFDVHRMPTLFPASTNASATNKSQSPNSSVLDLSDDERKIVTALQFSPSNASKLIEKTGLATTSFNILASELELRGLIVEHNGTYRICNL